MFNPENIDPKGNADVASAESKAGGEFKQGQIWLRIIRWFDEFLDGIYRNRLKADPPKETSGRVWGMRSIAQPLPWMAGSPIGNSQLAEFYYLHYFQSQGYGPTTNECVTTSALMSMNILKDLIALRQSQTLEPDRNITEYTRDLDALGIRGWKYRFSTRSPFPGMMTPWQALFALNDYAASLREKYGKSYRAKLSSRNKLQDLIEQLRNGNIVLIHGAWKMTLDRNNKQLGYNPLLALLGGMPHTMVLVGYDGDASIWHLLNPADPWPEDKQKPVTPKLYKMNTQQLMDFWGRKFLFYPPRFALTRIALDN